MSDQWYYGQNGVQKGPVSLEMMQQLIRGGHVKRDDLVWKEGMANWAPASAIAELFPAAPVSPVTPQPQYQPPQPGPATPVNPTGPVSFDPVTAALQNKATTAMVLGICSIVPGSCCSPLGLGLGIAAIILSNGATGAPNPGPAKAGFVCGIIGVVLSCLSFVGWIVR